MPNHTKNHSRNYKDADVIIKQADGVIQNMSAAVVYLPEVNQVTHLEVAEYTIEQFLSDVGGAAGLFIGMSLATVIGTCDFIFLMIYESVRKTLFNKRIGDIANIILDRDLKPEVDNRKRC